MPMPEITYPILSNVAENAIYRLIKGTFRGKKRNLKRARKKSLSQLLVQ